uniref:Uncharacterized protein n=1 Tax=Leersia perrieri TaxID=77586 RepID=A0A0D9VJE4_9ORYZ
MAASPSPCRSPLHLAAPSGRTLAGRFVHVNCNTLAVIVGNAMPTNIGEDGPKANTSKPSRDSASLTKAQR